MACKFRQATWPGALASAVRAAVTLAAASAHSSSGTLGAMCISTSKQQSKLAAAQACSLHTLSLRRHSKRRATSGSIWSSPLSVTALNSRSMCAVNSDSSPPKFTSAMSASHFAVNREPGVSARAVLSWTVKKTRACVGYRCLSIHASVAADQQYDVHAKHCPASVKY